MYSIRANPREAFISSMTTFAEQIIHFNRSLEAPETGLPDIKAINPFLENPEILGIAEKFYLKYYNDHHPRRFILGINPGRLGAGATGVPFTDTKRLEQVCGIKIPGVHTHEPSSVFIYEMIDAFGGPEKFYGDYYIHSIFPLALVRLNEKQKWVNCNYYDEPRIFKAVKPFIITNIEKQLSFNVDRSRIFVLGKKNAEFLKEINEEYEFFKEFIVLEHPRFIVQYKSRQIESYIRRYLEILS